MTSMAKPSLKPKPSFKRCLAAMLVAAGSLAAASTAVLAQDDDEPTFEQQMFNKLFGRDKPPIDYRERSPLVIPPSSELPPPESAAAAQGAAAWPNDPDVAAQRKAARSRVIGAEEATRAAARPLSPDEIKRGRVARGSQAWTPTPSDAEMGRVLRPGEIGGKEYSLFSLFGKSMGNEKVEQFAGEPTRQFLTEPPPGYRTPSPAQPYQPPKSEPIFKLPSLFDHGTQDPN